MKIDSRLPHRLHLVLITIAGALASIGVLINHTTSFAEWTRFLPIGLSIVLLTIIPVQGRQTTYTFNHAIVLGVGMLYGIGTANAGAITGFILASIFHYVFSRKSTLFQRNYYSQAAYEIGLSIIPLTISLSMFNWFDGLGSHGDNMQILFSDALPLSLVYFGIHTFLIAVAYILRKQTINFSGDILIDLAWGEVLPLPFILIAGMAYSEIGNGSIAIITFFPIIFTYLFNQSNVAQRTLRRRVKELSLLSQISQILHHSINLEILLDEVNKQITNLLGTENFYVALYDQAEKSIWYPLAVKHGERQIWDKRPLANRLTDRVIRERKPIMIARDASTELEHIGVPLGDEKLYAWLGLPLMTAERVLGCLAVMSISEGVAFTPEDQELLTTISGQISIALENALLYEQAQKRAGKLEALNQSASSISAQLDLEEVLAEISRSSAALSDSKRSAFFLLDGRQGQVNLVHASGLSEEFIKESQSFPESDRRSNTIKTGKPMFNPNLDAITQGGYLRMLSQEGIKAYIDLPLNTPNGVIGFISLYFEEPQIFGTEEVDLLQTFASQSAMAITNAKLYAQTDQALSEQAEQLRILEEVGRKLSAAMHSNELFEIILDHTLAYTKCPWGSMTIYDSVSNTFEIKSHRGYKIKS
ncbi:MAG: GAF domain-containing protein, partial [Anaerolineae bacterium]|nr:GAF domain-containing protein [Anaerolineae bacterium]